MSNQLTIGERPNKKNIESLDLTQKVNLLSSWREIKILSKKLIIGHIYSKLKFSLHTPQTKFRLNKNMPNIIVFTSIALSEWLVIYYSLTRSIKSKTSCTLFFFNPPYYYVYPFSFNKYLKKYQSKAFQY